MRERILARIAELEKEMERLHFNSIDEIEARAARDELVKLLVSDKIQITEIE